MKGISREAHKILLKRCQSGKHKLRENKFGVVWCVHCGLLSTSVGSVSMLKEEDKVEVIKTEN